MTYYETAIYGEIVCMRFEKDTVTFGIRGHDGVLEWADPRQKISCIDTSPSRAMTAELRRIHSPDEKPRPCRAWGAVWGAVTRDEFRKEVEDAVNGMATKEWREEDEEEADFLLLAGGAEA